MPRRDIIFRTTKNAHILQPTLSTGHDQGGEVGRKREYSGLFIIRVGPKDYTHKNAIYLKNHWIIFVP